MVTLHEVITFLVSMQISISSLQTHNVNRCGRSRHLARKLSLRRKRSSPNVFEMAATETITSIILIKLIRVSLGTVRHPRCFKIVVIDIQITLKQMLKIGRASCRERVYISVVCVLVKKKEKSNLRDVCIYRCKVMMTSRSTATLYSYIKFYFFLFFFKQKTAYEIGLGIPAEPLFRSNGNHNEHHLD